jgi:hypothetical protein
MKGWSCQSAHLLVKLETSGSKGVASWARCASKFGSCVITDVGRDSAVGVETLYGLAGPGIESW